MNGEVKNINKPCNNVLYFAECEFYGFVFFIVPGSTVLLYRAQNIQKIQKTLFVIIAGVVYV